MSVVVRNEPDTALSGFLSRLIEAHETGTRFAPDGPVPETSDAALAIQSVVMERYGSPAGFKVADKPGAPFVMAPIRQDRVFKSGDDVPIIDNAGIELEIGFEIIKPIANTDDLGTLVACLRPLPVIEIVDTRISGPLAKDPIVKLADQQANGALVIGAPIETWTNEDFSSVDAKLTCGAETLVDGPASVPGGSALALVARLAARLGLHCGGLQPGQFIITGSLNGLPFFPVGTRVDGAISGLGKVTCRLTGQ